MVSSNNTEWVSCDLCGGEASQPYRNPADRTDIVQCTKCGLVYTNPRPTEECFLEVSAEDPLVFRPPEVLREREKGRHLGLLAELSRFPPGTKLLDVGCGHGFLLALALERGFDVYGVEIQPSLADYAGGVFGLRVHCGDLNSARYPEGFFDVITAHQVLEHVLSPSRLLGEMCRILKPEGLLHITVPNVESVNARRESAWWGEYDMYPFSTSALRELLAKAGFRFLSEVVQPHLPSAASLLGKIIRRFLCRRASTILAARSMLSTKLGQAISSRTPQAGISVWARKAEQ